MCQLIKITLARDVIGKQPADHFIIKLQMVYFRNMLKIANGERIF